MSSLLEHTHCVSYCRLNKTPKAKVQDRLVIRHSDNIWVKVKIMYHVIIYISKYLSTNVIQVSNAQWNKLMIFETY